jgi:hypothetical protein
LPIGIYGLQFGLLAWFSLREPVLLSETCRTLPSLPQPKTSSYAQSVSSRTFLRMAWWANPFACIGINTLIATIPALAQDLHFSTTASGLFCSIWFFARLAAFIVLWRWAGWHYRFRWFLAAFLGLMVGFATLLIFRDYWLLFVAQIVFGFSVGLIYYSSLLYSMDLGHTKGEHGGLHEAAMGVGNCLGPALGVAALLLAPQTPNAGAYAVSGLLGVGLLGLFRLRFWDKPPPHSEPKGL